MSNYPVPHTVVRRRRTLLPEPDHRGNDQWSTIDEEVPVSGWALYESDEPRVARHLRQEISVRMYAPVGTFQPDDVVLLPPYGKLEVVGHPQNYSHGPFGWDPQLEVAVLEGTYHGNPAA